jgi:hypothetical protein
MCHKITNWHKTVHKQSCESLFIANRNAYRYQVYKVAKTETQREVRYETGPLQLIYLPPPPPPPASIN